MQKFIETVDKFEQQIDDSKRQKYLEEYTAKIKGLKNLIDSERFELKAEEIEINKSIQAIKNDKTGKVWECEYKKYCQYLCAPNTNVERYYRFLIDASDSDIPMAHIGAADYLFKEKKVEQAICKLTLAVEYLNNKYEDMTDEVSIEFQPDHKKIADFDKEFTNWFEEEKISSSILEETDKNRLTLRRLYPKLDEYFIKTPQFRGYDHYINLYLYYKFRQSVHVSGLNKKSEKERHFILNLNDENCFATVQDKEIICGSFIIAAVGSRYAYDDFTAEWLIHPYSGAYIRYDDAVDIHLADLSRDFEKNFFTIQRSMIA